MRILFTTMPLSGHFYTLVPLAWAFRAVGHEVLVSTSDAFVPAALRSGLPVAGSGPAGDFVSLAGPVPSGPGARRLAHGRAFGRISAATVAGTVSIVDSWRPDLVISERAELAGPVAAAAREVPQVQFHWGIEALPEYRAAGAVELAGQLDALGLDGLPEPARVLNPWPPSLREPFAAAHERVRFVAYNGDAHVPAWVFQPRSRPRICLTLGTLVSSFGLNGRHDLAGALLERLADLDAELLVAVDPEIAATWPPLPAAVRFAGRLPLAQVLPACDAVIHHGGQGTVLTALAAQCPQLALPQLDDQFGNAAAVVRSRAGLSLPPDRIDPDTVAARCRDLLASPGFAAAAAGTAAELAAQPCLTEIVSLLEKA